MSPVLTPLSLFLSVALTQLGDWVYEKMLMARDSSRDETQKLHKKWLKHQAFMAELAQNKEWLDKIEKVSAACRPKFDLCCRYVCLSWKFACGVLSLSRLKGGHQDRGRTCWFGFNMDCGLLIH